MVLDEFVDTVQEAIGDADIDDAQPQIVRKGEDYPRFKIRERNGGNIVELNIDAWDKESREEVIQQLEPLFHEQEGIFLPETNKYKIISESGVTNKRINETAEFFDDYLSTQQTKLLRRCLSIRQDWERDDIHISKSEMDDLKYDLSQEFNYAFTVANLASSGYYDQEGYFRDVFEELDDSGVSESEYMRIYFELLEEEPFFVFVGESAMPSAISKAIKNRLSKHNTYPVPIEFVDALAVGGRAREILEKAVLETQRDIDCVSILVEVDYNTTCYRFYPKTVEGISF